MHNLSCKSGRSLFKHELLASIAICLSALYPMSGGCPVEETLGPDYSDEQPIDVPLVAGASDGVKNELQLSAINREAATISGQPLAIVLTAEGVTSEKVSVDVTEPEYGAVDVSKSVGKNAVEVTYTPPDGFVGRTSFQYSVAIGDAKSNQASVGVVVYPDVRFEAEVTEGPFQSHVRVQALAAAGADLPEGTYTWSFDDHLEAGPLDTHSQLEYSFARPGRHLISLTITLAGLASPVACVTNESAPEKFYKFDSPSRDGMLSVSPKNNWRCSGEEGGPFDPSSYTYTITNIGGRPADWSVACSESWIHFSQTSGRLRPDESADILVFIGEAINARGPGRYADSIVFQNVTNGQGNASREFELVVRPPRGELQVSPADAFVSSGDEGGPFSPSSKTYTLTNVGGQTVDWSAAQSQSWIDLSTSDGRLEPGDSETVVVSINASADSLHANAAAYENVVSFVNETNHRGDAERQAILTVSQASHAISGRITASGVGLAGVAMNGLPGSPTTDANGYYSADVVAGFSGEVTPSKTGYDFTPASRTYANVSQAQLNQDFAAAKQTFIVSGRITEGASGLANVVMNGLPGSPATDADGYYSATVQYGFSGVVTPSKADYDFTPANRTYVNISQALLNQDFAAAVQTFAVSGRITASGAGLAGVAMNGLSGSPTTDANGYYSADVEAGFSGEVTPSKTGYDFTPASRTYANVSQAQLNQDFAAAVQTFIVSGRITEGASGLANVVMNGLPGSPATDADGYYSATVEYGFSGVATPSKAGYSFTPASRTYANVSEAQLNHNYSGALIGNCETSNGTWQNYDMGVLTGAFTVEYDAVPGGAAIDSLTALSSGDCGTWSDAAVIVRFNDSGQFDARNGGSYSADAAIAYSAGVTYHVRIEVNVPAHAYSVYVQPDGQAEQLLASDYAFRTEQSAVASLDTWSLNASSGSHDACDMTVTASGNMPPVADAGPDQVLVDSDDNGSETVTLNGGGSVDYDGDIASYVWSENGGDIATGVSPNVSLSVGVHEIKLTVTDDDDDVDTDVVVVTVNAAGGGDPLTPIARWDIVPYQRINAGETLKCGVVAFSKNGIQKVSFSINGDAPIDVTAMTLNDQSNVYEYWTSISGDDFTSDGQISVTAIVHGAYGGTRTLDPLILTVNPNGTLPQVEAWVDVAGNDSTGAVNDDSRPFLSVGKALEAIRDWRDSHGFGHNADGGLVRLNPGLHTCSNGGVWSDFPTTVNEWVTITAAAGGTPADTILQSGEWCRFETRLLAFRGIGLQRNPGDGYVTTTSNDFGVTASCWIDETYCTGSGRWTANSNPIGANTRTFYFTDSTLYDCQYPTMRGVLCRGLTIEKVGCDSFNNVPMIVNCTVDDIHPGETGWHGDCVQYSAYGENHNSNSIIYGLRGTNLHYQAAYTQDDDGPDPGPADGIAWVNVYMKLTSPLVSGGGGTQWKHGVHHFLLWHVTLTDNGGVDNYFSLSKRDGTSYSDVSIVGCCFESFLLWSGGDQVDLSDAKHNHYVATSGIYVATPGTDYTTGAHNLDENGRPTGAPLINRVAPFLTPTDAEGQPRMQPGADVGAYEG